ncbi:TPA: replication-associated recombination protein A [Candidatus Galligastranaerophilus intestinigallinarum]|nr:replication-associated recombination protein A [Candidatus Galligastranaerophilus intestinigallinarum]
MNLFDSIEENNKQMPLANILRPKNLDEYLGQTNVISENSPIYNLLKSNRIFSFILWGPPGCGKTTLARLIANHHNANFMELSAVTSGVKDVKDAVQNAKENLRNGVKTILFIDEIHRYSKTQQDALLPHIENGTLHLMGSTTENPSFQVIPALLSRVQVIMLNPIDKNSMEKIVQKGFNYLSENYKKDLKIEDDAIQTIVKLSNGDARFALNTVENSYFAAKNILNSELIEKLLQQSLVKYDESEHYDCLSAYQKSLRGSDPNAAIYYLAKMLTKGEDPRIIARRLVVTASEDVGNGDYRALLIANAALNVVNNIGMPECRIALSQATEYVARAKKRNLNVVAIDNAMADIRQGKDYPPPMHLRDSHYKDAKKYGFGEGYVYTHNNPDYIQQFMPDEMKDVKYF